MQNDGEEAAKYWVMGRLEFLILDGKAASSLVYVTEGRVAQMSDGEAVSKCRVMWGLEVGVSRREAMGEHWEYVRELSPWLIWLW